MTNFKVFFYKFILFIYDILGIKLIWEKINPPPDDTGERPPRTFFLWLLGIYVSLFGLASSRYEQISSRLESQKNFIISQAESDNWKVFSTEIANLQLTKIPTSPTITCPLSVIASFFHYFDKIDDQTVNELQAVIYRKKSNLSDLNLSNLILSNNIDLVNSDISGKSFKIYAIKNRNFSKSKFENSILDKADLKNINFYKSNFKNAVLTYTNMSNCNLSDSNLKDAILMKANLNGANLLYSTLQNAVLEETNFQNAILIGVDLTETHDIETANFTGALYNSRTLELKNIPKDHEINSFCNKNQLPRSCYDFLKNNINSIFEKATKFPSGFNPKLYNMIDVVEIVNLSGN